jgi:plasmid stabilization system protein ParE
MFEILWLDSAINDLVRLKDFLSEINPLAASRSALLIKNATNQLRDFPFIGKPVEDLDDFYDLFIEFGAYGYHLRYRVFSEKIYIIHIKHTKELKFEFNL